MLAVPPSLQDGSSRSAFWHLQGEREEVEPTPPLEGIPLERRAAGDVHSSLHTSAPSWHGLTPFLQAVDMLWGTVEEAWEAIGLYILESEDCSLWQALTASPNIALGQRSMCHPTQERITDAILGCKAKSLQ